MAKVPSMFSSMMQQRCPRCRKGPLYSSRNPFNFKRIADMPDECPVCGQDYVIEPGFYFGATYISYAMNVAWLVPTFLFIRFVLGLEFRVFVIVMFSLLPILVPLIFRLSRSIWAHFFMKFDPTIAEQVRSSD